MASDGVGQVGTVTDSEKAAPIIEKDIRQQQTSRSSSSSTPSLLPPPRDQSQPHKIKFWAILLATFLALFIVALDRTIIAPAVPRITDTFHSLGDIGWYASAYMLTTSASQLAFGRLYKFYSIKNIFLSCVVVFEAGSALCGAAPSSSAFIAGRAIAGIGAAGILSGCMLIMIPMIPLSKRPMLQGLFGVVFGLASVVGPLLGGAFTNSGLTWRWCFYINLPFGGVTLLLMIVLWHPPARPPAPPLSLAAHLRRLDPLGTALFVPAIVCLLLALQWGGAAHPWSSWRVLLLLILAVVLLAAFALVQALMPDTATLPGRVFLQRSVLSGTFFTFFLSGSMLVLIYFVPVWFQTTQRVDPLRSGINSLPLVLSLVISSILSGIVTQRIGYYVPSMLTSPSIMAVGEGLMSTFSPSTRASHWIGFQFIAGFGVGLGMQIGNLAVQTVLEPDDISTGIAIMAFVQQLGGAVFISVSQTVLNNLLVARLRHVSGLDPTVIVQSGATELGATIPQQLLPVVIDAYNVACTRVFLTAMSLTLCALIAALFMEWRSMKKPEPGSRSLPSVDKDNLPP